MKFGLSVTAFMFCSGGMMLVNKQVMLPVAERDTPSTKKVIKCTTWWEIPSKRPFWNQVPELRVLMWFFAILFHRVA